VIFTVRDNGEPPLSDSETITITVGGSTLIELSSFIAYPSDGMVLIEWITESEIDTVGFNLYRASSRDREYTQINSSLIPAEGSPTEGAQYFFIDEGVKNRRMYFYQLEDIDIYGVSTFHGPVSATPRKVYKLRDR
jgi:hypothetical protein